MFDNIQWEYDLPDEEHVGKVFQTKDFDCTMTLYKVDKHGQLYIQVQHGTVASPMLILHPCEYEWKPYNHTVSINFYEYSGNDEWIEYKAAIEDGKVIYVVKVFEDR